MVLDSLIIRFAINGKSVQAHVTADIERMIKRIQKKILEMKNASSPSKTSHKSIGNTYYFHPMIVMNFNLVRLSMELCIDPSNPRTKTLERIIKFVKSNKDFATEMHFFLRAVLLSIEGMQSFNNMWLKICNQLLTCAKENTNISSDTIYFILHLLTKETEGQKQIELLRGLTSFAEIKDNMPLILNTYRSLSSAYSGVLRILSVNLHTRLWLSESRTYQFLHKVLIADEENLSKSERWEMNVAKADAIKTICSSK